MTLIWNEKNTFMEHELKQMAELGEVRALVAQENMDGYHVIAEGKIPVLNAVSGKYERKWRQIAWRTRREHEPRTFHSLERLMDRLADYFPSIREVKIEMLLPGERAKKVKSAKEAPKVGRPTKQRSTVATKQAKT